MALLELNCQLSQLGPDGLSCLELVNTSWAICCPNNFSDRSISEIDDNRCRYPPIFVPSIDICSRCLETEKFLHLHQPHHVLTILAEKNFSALPDTCQLFGKFLRGNLYSMLGDYEAADSSYEETMMQQQKVQSPHFTVWIKIYCAWNALLQEHPEKAYKLLYHNRETPTREQEYSIQFVLAITDCLRGRYDHVEQTLKKVSAFFLDIQNYLQSCTAQLYLAYLYLQTERSDQARVQIQEALTWLHQTSIDYLPHWWHPEIMAQVFAHAIAYSIHPYTAERIFVKYIGQKGKDALYTYLYTEDVAIQRNCYTVYSLISDELTDLAPDTSNHYIKQSIRQLLSQGKLRPEGFICLQRTLTTATQRKKPNAALIATFGLYVQRYDRVEIAEALDLSQSTVRNYITTLYEIFDLDQQAYDGQRSRFRHLVAIAKERGFVS